MALVSARAYDFLYRRGAPWEGGPREELVRLVEGGRLAPEALPAGRAIDLGCGSGANAVFLARAGFEVTGVDFSAVALAKGEAAAAAAGVDVRFVRADLTAPAIPGVEGPFDLLVDYGTLDDLRAAQRPAMAALVTALARPGAVFLLWCFYDEIAWWRRRGARFPGLRPGSEQDLLGAAFTVERLAEPRPGSGFACFLATRR